MLFVYGRILSPRLVNTVTSDKVLYKLVSNLIKYHMVICYFLYIAGKSIFLLGKKTFRDNPLHVDCLMADASIGLTM